MTVFHQHAIIITTYKLSEEDDKVPISETLAELMAQQGEFRKIKKKVLQDIEHILGAPNKFYGDAFTQKEILIKAVRLMEDLEEFSAEQCRVRYTTVEGGPIWLAPRATIEEWLSKHLGLGEAKILFDPSEAPTITSPQELDPRCASHGETTDHMQWDRNNPHNELDEYLGQLRASQATNLGIRDALLCCAKWQEIPPALHNNAVWYEDGNSWGQNKIYFANAVIDFGSCRLFVVIQPYVGGCRIGTECLCCVMSCDKFARLS